MKMKKFVSLVLVLTLALALAACGGEAAATKMTMGTGGTTGMQLCHDRLCLTAQQILAGLCQVFKEEGVFLQHVVAVYQLHEIR